MIIFFSSRRRHTRYWRDWSSDVCSSDLADNDGTPEQWGLGTEASVIRVAPFIWQNGGGLVDDDRAPTKLLIDEPAAREGHGRASRRGREEISGVAVSLKKKKTGSTNSSL